MVDWQQLDREYVISTYGRLPLVIDRAEGNYLYDEAGKAYLDLFTGLAVNVLGHAHPKVMDALEEQSNKFLHISNIFINKPAIILAKKLVEHSIEGGKVFFANSGAEATEAAIKLIHKWTVMEKHDREGILVIKNGFHGRTLGALRLTRQSSVRQDYPQPSFPVYEIEANDIDQLHHVCRSYQVAAVLVEPVLGSGGVVPLTDDFLREIFHICHESGILCCMDEIQTGMGRTGTLFAYQHTELIPDMILFAKGVGGGLPLSGVIAGPKLADLFQPGDHGTTFAPSPLAAAMGNAVLEVLLEQGQMEEGRKTAEYLWDRLQELQSHIPDVISGVLGRGMMIGIGINRSSKDVARLQKNLLAEGILVNVTQKTIVRLLPPLTLTLDEVDRFAETFGRLAGQMK